MSYGRTTEVTAMEPKLIELLTAAVWAAAIMLAGIKLLAVLLCDE